METILYPLLAGLGEAIQPLNFAMLVLGCFLGLMVGALPGLGSVNGVAILLPITFLVPPATAIIFLAAIYYGAMYGGAVSSIALGIPGASTAVATVFDGRPLAMQGKADLAMVARPVRRSSVALSRSSCSPCSRHLSPTSPCGSARRRSSP